jgi:hypothetical protein
MIGLRLSSSSSTIQIKIRECRNSVRLVLAYNAFASHKVLIQTQSMYIAYPILGYYPGLVVMNYRRSPHMGGLAASVSDKLLHLESAASERARTGAHFVERGLVVDRVADRHSTRKPGGELVQAITAPCRLKVVLDITCGTDQRIHAGQRVLTRHLAEGELVAGKVPTLQLDLQVVRLCCVRAGEIGGLSAAGRVNDPANVLEGDAACLSCRARLPPDGSRSWGH